MTRILVVEDFEDFRALITSMLKAESNLEVICEVSDGLSAVARARDLSPDLVLMDIGLPELNGIEAARQIRQASPHSKVLFLSALESLDIVEASLETGASGYIIKRDVRSELLAAVKAVSQGQRFVSSRLKGFIPDGPTSELRVPAKPHATGSHEVLFYSDETVFQRSVSDFIGSSLRAGDVAILFATKPHRKAVFRTLHAQDLDVSAAIKQGSYVPLDAAEVLSTFMVDGWPDEDRFVEAFTNIIETALKAAKAAQSRVAIFGEAVALLWADGKIDAALRLEQLGHRLARTPRVNILCAYPVSLHIQEDKRAFNAICAEHSAVYAR